MIRWEPNRRYRTLCLVHEVFKMPNIAPFVLRDIDPVGGRPIFVRQSKRPLHAWTFYVGPSCPKPFWQPLFPQVWGLDLGGRRD